MRIIIIYGQFVKYLYTFIPTSYILYLLFLFFFSLNMEWKENNRGIKIRGKNHDF